MPIMPMDPAKAVSTVLPFFVSRFVRLRFSAVRMLIERFFFPSSADASSRCGAASRVMRSSLMTFPSSRRIIRSAYSFASSGLCVTMITRRSRAISRRISITWMLVSLSRAPVGSSASRISGLFTRARAMATRCICPPLSSFGFFLIWSFSPTFSSASIALRRRSSRPMPLSVSASSTFASTVWCGIRL